MTAGLFSSLLQKSAVRCPWLHVQGGGGLRVMPLAGDFRSMKSPADTFLQQGASKDPNVLQP